MFPKQKRIVNKKLISKLQKLDCVACGKPGPNDVHHLTTKAAGGNDTKQNLLTLCRICHCFNHTMGNRAFASKFFNVKLWLIDNERFDIIGVPSTDRNTRSTKD